MSSNDMLDIAYIKHDITVILRYSSRGVDCSAVGTIEILTKNYVVITCKKNGYCYPLFVEMKNVSSIKMVKNSLIS